MFKAYKFKLKPTVEQREILTQMGGISRWIWNYMLDLNKTTYNLKKEFVFAFDMDKSLKELKKTHDWISTLPTQAMQQKCADLDSSIKRVYESGFGFPNFKSKKDLDDSFRIPNQNNSVRATKKQIKIPKLGWVNWKRHRPLEGKIKSITIKQENGEWFCSCVCQLPDVNPILDVDDLLGIDLGLKDFCITSDGEVFDTPKFYRNKQTKLAKLQRSMARKIKGSKNRNKARVKLAKLHKKIRNQRMDFTHKISAAITKQNLFIGVETLNIKGMTRNKNLSKSIMDQGWGMFIRQLEYKSLANGGKTVKIDRWAPSTKTCSCCGQTKNITLNERTYVCAHCGMSMDRDVNAAINIRSFALSKLSRCGTHQINAWGDTSDGIDSSISNVSANHEKFLEIIQGSHAL